METGKKFADDPALELIMLSYITKSFANNRKYIYK